jgi:hypothetical protein
MMQMIFELLQPEEIASCMMVCKAWMSDAKQHPKAWRGKTLRIYTDPPRHCNPIYSEPWTSIALRYIESVTINRPMPLGYPAEKGEDKDETPYACLLRGFKRGTLPNIVRIEMSEVDPVYFRQVCSILPRQVGLESVILNDIHPGICLRSRLALLKRCKLRHANIFTSCDFYHTHESFMADLQESLLTNRSLESLVVPLHNSNNQTPQDDQLNYFANVILPSILSGAPGSVPPLKRLEFLVQSVNDPISSIVTLLQHYGKMGTANNQLELLRVVHPRFYNTYGYLHGLQQLFDKAFDIATHLRDGPLRPESRLRIEVEFQAENYSKISLKVCAAALELLTPEERLLASQRVLLK